MSKQKNRNVELVTFARSKDTWHTTVQKKVQPQTLLKSRKEEEILHQSKTAKMPKFPRNLQILTRGQTGHGLADPTTVEEDEVLEEVRDEEAWRTTLI